MKLIRGVRKKGTALLAAALFMGVVTAVAVSSQPMTANTAPGANALTWDFYGATLTNASAAVAGGSFTVYSVAYKENYAQQIVAPASGVPVILYKQTANVGGSDYSPASFGWQELNSATSGSDGSFGFTVTENTAGVYKYSVGCIGPNMGLFHDSHDSLDVTVVPPSPIAPTTKTLATLDVYSPQDRTLKVRVGQPLSITGWLTTELGISDATILLQKWDGTAWISVSSATTDVHGMAVLSSVAGKSDTYFYRLYYEGSETLASTASEYVNVKVIA